MPDTAARASALPNRRVAVLAYDGLCTFEFGIAVEVFGLPRPELGEDWYRFMVCGLEAGPLSAVGGIRVEADGGLAELAAAGTVIIPGWRDPEDVPPPALLEALRVAHAAGARLLSICSGVFVLAAAGLLDGRRATTHWRYTEALRARYPAITVDADVLYVDGGQVLTSAGSAAGLDLALHLVRRDFGPGIANQVARRLVLPPHRDGGQAQYIDRPVPDRVNSLFAAVFEHVRRDVAADHSVAALARMAAMSERTFLRRFREATGQTPSDWLTAERLARARDLLEVSRLPLEEVAAAAGFATAAALRHQFRKRFGVAPAEYRRTFAHAR